MGAEEERDARRGRRKAAEEVAAVGADERPGAVLDDLDAKVAEEARSVLARGTLLPARAGDRGELEEEVDDLAQEASPSSTSLRAGIG